MMKILIVAAVVAAAVIGVWGAVLLARHLDNVE